MNPITSLKNFYQAKDTDGGVYWVSPQCAECGEVEHADTLDVLLEVMAEHYCR